MHVYRCFVYSQLQLHNHHAPNINNCMCMTHIYKWLPHVYIWLLLTYQKNSLEIKFAFFLAFSAGSSNIKPIRSIIHISRHPLEEQRKIGRGNVSRQLADCQENLISYSYHTCLLADEDSGRMHARLTPEFLWCMCHCNRDTYLNRELDLLMVIATYLHK